MAGIRALMARAAWMDGIGMIRPHFRASGADFVYINLSRVAEDEPMAGIRALMARAAWMDGIGMKAYALYTERNNRHE